MARPPLGFHDSFTEQGLFWLAGKRDDEVTGALIGSSRFRPHLNVKLSHDQPETVEQLFPRRSAQSERPRPFIDRRPR